MRCGKNTGIVFFDSTDLIWVFGTGYYCHGEGVKSSAGRVDNPLTNN